MAEYGNITRRSLFRSTPALLVMLFIAGAMDKPKTAEAIGVSFHGSYYAPTQADVCVTSRTWTTVYESGDPTRTTGPELATNADPSFQVGIRSVFEGDTLRLPDGYTIQNPDVVLTEKGTAVTSWFYDATIHTFSGHTIVAVIESLDQDRVNSITYTDESGTTHNVNHMWNGHDRASSSWFYWDEAQTNWVFL